ncbi:hypothetical protein KUH32_09675 [Thalassococcus sp. CAU 1522]|uniref:Uncharacterized protein n=1 Tax=Thalassococcus arenae TaxID=2851652 RepID=A0ABS6N8B5_9RHOB|nr:hypothetical protein [Thalassococcus arenae]MBV2360043.1 hypothetical protein [Thalassococcus arenae]
MLSIRILALVVAFLTPFAPAALAQTETVDFAIDARGTSGGRDSAYAMRGQIDERDGSFQGTYDFNLSGDIGAGTWRAAAKRGWDLKLRWGTPANPPPLAVFGGFDLTIESTTVMVETGAEFATSARIGGNRQALEIALRYAEPAQHGGSGGLEQTSFSTFAGDGPGRVLFQTSHHDETGEFATTRGVIRLVGAPQARMEKPVHTQFVMVFAPGPDPRRGRFKGQTTVIDRRPDLPAGHTVNDIFTVPGAEQKYCCEFSCPTLNPSSCKMTCEKKRALACTVFTVNCPNQLGDGGCVFE